MKKCEICGETSVMYHIQRYCPACKIARANAQQMKYSRQSQADWNKLDAEEQIRRMDIAVKKIIDDSNLRPPRKYKYKNKKKNENKNRK